MIEMVVVLLLMGIIAATVLGRSIATSDIDLNSETDKIRNHLRFAQAEAMKRSNTVWGIKSAEMSTGFSGTPTRTMLPTRSGFQGWLIPAPATASTRPTSGSR